METHRKYHLDKPENNETGYSRFYFCGWVLPPEKGIRFEIYSDNKPFPDFTVRRVKRPDLTTAFPEIPDAENGGFEGIINLGSDEGLHAIQFFIITGSGERVEIGRKNCINSRTMINNPPDFFYIGLISDCNLSCTMCPKHSPRSLSTVKKGIMKKPLVDKIISELVNFSPSVKLIGLQDYGEPFLHKEIFAIVNHLGVLFPEADIHVSTNGTLLNHAVIDKILASGITSINISLDASTEKTYREIRKNADFSKVCSNIRNLVQKRNMLQKEKLIISTNFVIMQSNLDEMIGYLSLCKSLGVDVPCLVHPFGIFESDREEVVFSLHENESGLGEKFLKIKKEFDGSDPLDKKIYSVPDIIPNYFLTECSFFGKRSMYIDSRGDVYPCCVIAAKGQEHSSAVIPLGNVTNQTLSEIWQSPDYISFRENFYRGIHPHPVCQGCSKYYGI